MADRSFLDWPFFDGDHRRLAEEIDRWAEAEIAPLEAEEPAGDAALDTLCRRLVASLAGGGWLRHCVPAAYGGARPGLCVRNLCLIRETLARRSGLADFCFVMQGLGTGAISLFGTEAQKTRYLPGTISGQRIAAFALSEPGGGSDVAAMETTARAESGGYVLDGDKTLISNAGIATQYVVFARTGEAEGAKGISAFVVDADTPGVSVPERFPVMAPHPLGTVRFENCRIDAAQRLAGPGEGFKVAMATLDAFRPTVGAAALGFARRALDEALARSRARSAFGGPLADKQLIRRKLADMAVRVDAAALLVYRSAWVKDVGGGRATREAAMAKLYATEAAQEVVDQAVQIFGGQGVIVGNAVERLYREVRALRIYEGTSEIQKLVISGRLLAGDGCT